MNKKKNQNANLESRKPTFLLMGLITAASISLAAMELVSIDKQPYVELSENGANAKNFVPDYVPQTPPPSKPEPIIPPEVDVPLDPPATDTEEADKDEDVDKNKVIIPDIPFTPPVFGKTEKKEAKIYDFPSQEASFDGGIDAMYEFLYKNIEYPKMAKAAGIQGKIFVEFIVDEEGKVSEVKTLNEKGGGLEEETIRVVKMLPNWTPAEQAGVKVKQRFRLPVKYVLE